MSPIETTTGLPAARTWLIARATTSDAKAEPPGLFTRSTTAPMRRRGGTAPAPPPACPSRRTIRARTGAPSWGRRRCCRRPAPPHPAGPGARRQRRGVGSAHATQARPSARPNAVSRSPRGDAVDQAGELGLPGVNMRAVDERTDGGPIHPVAAAGAVGGDAQPTTPAVESSSSRFLLARTGSRLLGHDERLRRPLVLGDPDQVDVDADAIHRRLVEDQFWPCRSATARRPGAGQTRSAAAAR